MFFKIGVLKDFAIFAGKHLCRSLFFNKVASPKACNTAKYSFLVYFDWNFRGKSKFKGQVLIALISVLTAC